MWTAEDIRVASVLEAGLGPVRVVEVVPHTEGMVWHSTPRATVGLLVSGGAVTDAPPYARNWAIGRPAEELLNDPRADTAWIPKENSVNPTDEAALDNAFGEDPEQEMAYATGQQAIAFPETSDNPHNHTYTWSPKLPDGSMLVIRSQTAQGLVEAVEAVAPHAARLKAAWAGVVGPAVAPASPFGAPTAPPFGPNVSVPGAPGYVGPPQAAAPQWGAPAPQQGGFGAPAAGAAGTRGPKPRPSWPQVYAIEVPFASKDAFKAFRTENQEALKGKVMWAGGGKYWIHGDVAAGFAAYNPMAA